MTPAEALLRKRLAASPQQVMPWSEVMALALYDETVGYYRYPRRIGRSGDFYTAVTVGPLYGQLLAELAQQTWQQCGKPSTFWIIEQGAHDGQLAEDVWTALTGTELAERVSYRIIEHRESYLHAQRNRLGPILGERLHFTAQPSEVGPAPGLILWNELADALPCERLHWSQGQWWRQAIGVGTDDALSWTDLPAPSDLTASLPTDLPDGYLTERCPLASAVAKSAAHMISQGAFYIADYGYTAEEYYSPDRAHGTLRRYIRHLTDDKLLEDLGEADLTAHVPFTEILDSLTESGWTESAFMDQGRFLTHLAKRWLSTLEGRPPSATTLALLRQFQTLTHPTHMGRAFRCLLMQRS
jgi:SAM-dependent MidA family methyltransferase